jgi:M6 family metalloprotease-like protein
MLITGCCLLLSLHAAASPAITTPVRKLQPDGTEIMVRLRGDEKIHWMETLDGYTLLHDAQHYAVYATTDPAGNMVPSTVRYAGESGKAYSKAANGFITSLQKGLRYSAAQAAVMRQRWDTDARAQAQAQTSAAQAAQAPVTGTKKALCVLMEFPDRPLSKTPAAFDSLINQIGYSEGGNAGSVRDFYKENSYGQLDLVVTVAGPYLAAHNHDYYNTDNAYTLAEEAVRAAHAAGIDLSELASASNRLENFHMIYAGHGQEASADTKDIWAHKYSLRQTITLGGVTIRDYSCSPELRGDNRTNEITCIGVICHELCHVFGAPDYYDTDSGTGGEFEGTGSWDLMADGNWNGSPAGSVPAHINMFQKILYGWVTPIELTDEQDITGMPNSVENPVAYTIKANDDGEHYLLENRQRRSFDASIPGHGLLIYHVHQKALGGAGSNARHPQQLYPVCASAGVSKPSAVPSSYGNINSGGCPFPGTTGKTYFTDSSVPMSFSWATDAGIKSPITGITESGGEISFEYKKKTIPTYTFTINHGDATTSKQTVALTFTVTGDAPLSYKASYSEDGLNYVAWTAYNPAAPYTFADNTAGYKTVYTKLRNEAGETGIQTAGIYYKPIIKSDNAPAAASAQEWSVKVYPTTVKDHLTVELGQGAAVDVAVFSTGGALHLTKKINAPAATIDLSACPAGLLLLRFSNGEQQVVKQVLKL